MKILKIQTAIEKLVGNWEIGGEYISRRERIRLNASLIPEERQRAEKYKRSKLRAKWFTAASLYIEFAAIEVDKEPDFGEICANWEERRKGIIYAVSESGTNESLVGEMENLLLEVLSVLKCCVTPLESSNFSNGVYLFSVFVSIKIWV